MSTSFLEVGGSLPIITKDPDATLDYCVVWSDWLAGDTLASVAWDVPTGLTTGATSINTTGGVTIDGVLYGANTVATIWLSGGHAGQVYTVRCRATTANSTPRIDDRSFRVVVAER